MKLRFEFTVEEISVLDTALFCYQKELARDIIPDDPDDYFLHRDMIARNLSSMLLNMGKVVQDGE